MKVTPIVYETVAKSQTGQVLGPTGSQGDYLLRLIIVPETLAAGTVALLDKTTSINVFVAGTLTDLRTIQLDFGVPSAEGAWSITTGDNVHVIAIGAFS